MRRIRGIVTVAVVIVVLGLGVRVLGNATQSRHGHVDPASTMVLVVEASSHGEEAGQSLEEMVTAQILRCRLQGHADPVGAIRTVAPGRFRAVLAPAMDHTDRRQFTGCLQDWSLDHLRVRVVRLGTP